MERKFNVKLSASAVEMKTFVGAQKPKVSYIVMQVGTKSGAQYHVFAEVEAKQAARHCGAPKRRTPDLTTNQLWDPLWKKP